MRKVYLLSLMTCFIGIISCNKDRKLVVKDTPNVFYTLPQGHQAYDDSIVKFYNKYKCFILYKFSVEDYNYNITGPVTRSLDMKVADTLQIANSLRFLDKNFFGVYPDIFLESTLPFKILLASRIKVLDVTDAKVIYQGLYNVYSGLNYVALGVVNDSLMLLNGHELDSTRGRLNAAFFKQGIAKGAITLPPDFSAQTDYSKIGPIGNTIARYPYGLLYTESVTDRFDAVGDLLAYIDIITSTDESTLEDTWFSPAIDINGLYRKKYNIVTSYYKQTYNVDLQEIGNLKN